MIDWIDECCKSWGAAKRRIWLGGYWIDGHFHQDGWSARSFADKLWREHIAAFDGRAVPPPEVMRGEALEVARALAGIRERWHTLLVYHYAVPRAWMSTGAKFRALSSEYPRRFQHVRQYYVQLHGAHCYILAHYPHAKVAQTTLKNVSFAAS